VEVTNGRSQEKKDMKRVLALVLIAMVVTLPGLAWAGSSTDAALGLGAFAALGTILLGAAALSHGAIIAPPPVVYAPPPPPAVVYGPPPPPPVVYPPPPPVYAPAPPVVYAPPPVVYAPRPAYRYGVPHRRAYDYRYHGWR
jgi:hypothetical protein